MEHVDETWWRKARMALERRAERASKFLWLAALYSFLSLLPNPQGVHDVCMVIALIVEVASTRLNILPSGLFLYFYGVDQIYSHVAGNSLWSATDNAMIAMSVVSAFSALVRTLVPASDAFFRVAGGLVCLLSVAQICGHFLVQVDGISGFVMTCFFTGMLVSCSLRVMLGWEKILEN